MKKRQSIQHMKQLAVILKFWMNQSVFNYGGMD